MTTITGYNSSPPSDDGSQTEANKIKWSTITGKVGDPLNNFLSNWHEDSTGSLSSTGSSNAYILATSLTYTALADIPLIVFKANHANTGAATIAIDGLAAKEIKKNHDVDLASGDIEANQIIALVYNVTDDTFEMVSQVANASGGGDLVDDTSPQLGGDLDLNGNSLDFPTTPNISDVLDEDDMSSDSATALATQQSIKAYVDALGNPQILTMSISNATGTTSIPWDDTVPTISEGTEIGTQAITLADNTNKVLIQGSFVFGASAGEGVTVALFRGSTCIQSRVSEMTASSDRNTAVFNIYDSPATASEITYSVRIGVQTATTRNWYSNQASGADDQGGSVALGGITLMEVAA